MWLPAEDCESLHRRLVDALCWWGDITVPRRIAYPVIGVAATLAAPLGLLLVRLGPGGLGWTAIRAEIFDDRATYIYLISAAVTVCVGLGALLGYQADRLLARSTIDELTELDNRWAFQRRLEAEIARSARYGTPVSVLLIDLDDFKSVNDHWGHLTGDRVLGEAGHAIRSSLRGADQGARLGGDEFAIVAPNTSEADAWVLAHRVSAAVTRETDRLGHRITVSVGISTFEPDGRQGVDCLRLVDAADRALYEAKGRGGNCVQAERHASLLKQRIPEARGFILHDHFTMRFRHLPGR